MLISDHHADKTWRNSVPFINVSHRFTQLGEASDPRQRDAGSIGSVLWGAEWRDMIAP